MELENVIKTRRAYRSLEPVVISPFVMRDLAECAALAPSCFNNQPWRFVFVHEPSVLEKITRATSKGNEWTRNASMVIAVFTDKALGCRIKDRDYYLFDTGMASAFLILRATELGLVAHPIAGFDEEKVKAILGIPSSMTVITLIIVGKKSEAMDPQLDEKKVLWEKERPQRMEIERFAFFNRYAAGSHPGK